MDITKIAGKERKVNEKSNQLRKNGFLPGVLYGENQETLPVVFNKQELDNVLKKVGDNAIFEVSVNEEIRPVMIKEVQRDPVSRDPIHIDLQIIHKDKKIHTELPIRLSGQKTVTQKGGIIQHQIDHITVEGYSKDIPAYITANLTDLVPGKNLLVSDLEISSELSIITPSTEVIVTILNADRQNTIEGVSETPSKETAPTEEVS